MRNCSDTCIVALKGGVVARVAAVELLLDLERRSFELRAAAGGRLRVRPRERLTAADRAAIIAHRDELLRLMNYCDEVM